MLGKLLNFLFGCRHRRLTRPMTAMGARGVPEGDPYVVCLECGARFAFDPREMRIGSVIRPDRDVRRA